MEQIIKSVSGPEVAPPKLIGIDDVVPGLVRMSKRGWLRLCETGRAPWGVKLGNRRLWNLAEVNSWIVAGCPAVRSENEVAK